MTSVSFWSTCILSSAVIRCCSRTRLSDCSGKSGHGQQREGETSRGARENGIGRRAGVDTRWRGAPRQRNRMSMISGERNRTSMVSGDSRRRAHAIRGRVGFCRGVRPALRVLSRAPFKGHSRADLPALCDSRLGSAHGAELGADGGRARFIQQPGAAQALASG